MVRTKCLWCDQNSDGVINDDVRKSSSSWCDQASNGVIMKIVEINYVHTINGVIAPFFGVIKIQCGVIISHVFS
jgi:hypothetical protein